MTARTDPGVAALRADLLAAVERDVAAPRRGRRGLRLLVAVVATLTATTGIAAATGLVFAPPQPDPSVPTVAEWTYYSANPYGQPGDDRGPVLLRHRPEVVARQNAESEALLRRDGVTARCGTDPGHPQACWLPDGQPVPPAQMTVVIQATLNREQPSDYDVRQLSATEAHRWLCEHPKQRPGADGGEKPAPTRGYEDC